MWPKNGQNYYHICSYVFSIDLFSCLFVALLDPFLGINIAHPHFKKWDFKNSRPTNAVYGTTNAVYGTTNADVKGGFRNLIKQAIN